MNALHETNLSLETSPFDDFLIDVGGFPAITAGLQKHKRQESCESCPSQFFMTRVPEAPMITTELSLVRCQIRS